MTWFRKVWIHCLETNNLFEAIFYFEAIQHLHRVILIRIGENLKIKHKSYQYQYRLLYKGIFLSCSSIQIYFQYHKLKRMRSYTNITSLTRILLNNYKYAYCRTTGLNKISGKSKQIFKTSTVTVWDYLSKMRWIKENLYLRDKYSSTTFRKSPGGFQFSL